jgi:hypothetical protein
MGGNTLGHKLVRDGKSSSPQNGVRSGICCGLLNVGICRLDRFLFVRRQFRSSPRFSHYKRREVCQVERR